MTKEINIEQTKMQDLDFACSLYNEAIKYQRRKGYPEYRWEDREAQKKYISEGIHYKVVIQSDIAAVFNVHFQDAKIWREMDNNTSIYLHGVLTNPKYKGNRLFGNILDWTIAYAQEHHKNNIRLDTWYNNPDLVHYYKSFGFYEVEGFQIPSSEDIPLNCRGNKVSLMEYKLEKH